MRQTVRDQSFVQFLEEITRLFHREYQRTHHRDHGHAGQWPEFHHYRQGWQCHPVNPDSPRPPPD